MSDDSKIRRNITIIAIFTLLVVALTIFAVMEPPQVEDLKHAGDDFAQILDQTIEIESDDITKDEIILPSAPPAQDPKKTTEALVKNDVEVEEPIMADYLDDASEVDNNETFEEAKGENSMTSTAGLKGNKIQNSVGISGGSGGAYGARRGGKMKRVRVGGGIPAPASNESYSKIVGNEFKYVSANPLSTFAVDVDSASYSNVRRFLDLGQMPGADVVRIEELINYFDYDYPTPSNEEAFSVYTELGESPWHKDYKVVHIGIKGREIETKNLPAMNLVFLIDVSGSMSSAHKLPLVKSSMKLLVQQLRKQDRVAIVVYASSTGVVLPSTSGADKQTILNALNQLHAGGSTAGGAGIDLAYKIASQHMIDGGINRVILATDGDFNVGTSGTLALGTMIEAKRDSGIYFSVFGFGMGNFKDDKLETLSNKGNGNYGYIDSYSEAQKVFVKGMTGTLATIATDVKIQVEFNPNKVASYRLLGYVNRMLKKEDFNNDKKDAGEIGAGHTVTALYEIIPVGVAMADVDPLKYQQNTVKKETNNSKQAYSDELMTVKIRYKVKVGKKSILLSSKVIKDKKTNTSSRFRFANAVAGFGMLLRQSSNKGLATYDQVIKDVRATMGTDENGYRHELLKLIEAAQQLHKSS